jgi:hypothetical protein
MAVGDVEERQSTFARLDSRELALSLSKGRLSPHEHDSIDITLA